jgi:hypothetical protein
VVLRVQLRVGKGFDIYAFSFYKVPKKNKRHLSSVIVIRLTHGYSYSYAIGAVTP